MDDDRDLVTSGPNMLGPEDSWGSASKTRGKGNMQVAIDFVTRFPVGSVVTIDDFDQWAQTAGLLNVPDLSASKDSDAWKAHLHRRHELRYRINNAGSHPRLRDNGSTPFSLDKLPGKGMYEVRPPHVAVAMSGTPAKIASFVTTRRKKLAYLMQSADWDALPAYERIMAESIFDDIDSFRGLINQQVESLDSKFNKLTSRLRKAVEAGKIVPTNGAIAGLLTADEDPGVDEDDVE